MKIKVEGLKEIEKALDDIARKSTRTTVMRNALRKAATPMAALAKSYAPRDQGDLEAGIKIGTKTVDEAGAKAFAATMKAGGSRDEAVGALRDARRAAKATNPAVMLFMGPNRESFHGFFQEFGTENHPPDPFMRPAFDAEAKPTIDRLPPLLWAEIDRAAKRAAKKAARGR